MGERLPFAKSIGGLNNEKNNNKFHFDNINHGYLIYGPSIR
jgi:hypothetical protein